MNKFILVVPSYDGEKFFVNKSYLNCLKLLHKNYYICDYNIKNINYNTICAILLTGGGDILPAIYGKKINNKTNSIYIERDIFEISVLKEALKRNIPTLAICRGIQIMNVAFGGTLNQNIDNHMQSTSKNFATHFVNINKNTILYNIFKTDYIKVNSFHHQVIDKLAKDFIVSAYCDDYIEAIEYNSKNSFFVGIQWHPETLHDKNSTNLFKYFVEKANEKT